MTRSDLWPQVGDLWVKPNGDTLEWRRDVKPGDVMARQNALINGAMPESGSKVDHEFFATDMSKPFYARPIYLAPGEGVQIYRNGVLIHPRETP